MNPINLDPRLLHLPDDLRAVAEEFLDLHSAWGTEFVARVYLDDGIEILWRKTDECAGFWWYGKDGWDLFAKELGERRGCRVEISGLRASSYHSRPLRRSHDFAEFVQRFAVSK